MWCIRLRRCDDNLYWLQKFVEMREFLKHTISTNSVKHIDSGSLVCTFSSVCIWFVLHLLISKFVGVKNPNYSVLLKNVQHPNRFNQHKATQKSFFIFCFGFFFCFSSFRLNYLLFCHLTSFIQTLFFLLLLGCMGGLAHNSRLMILSQYLIFSQFQQLSFSFQ